MRSSVVGAKTVRRSLNTIVKSFPRGTIEFVYLHGMWQKERGRGPTMLYGNHTDPRRAFAIAKEIVGPYIESVRAIPNSRGHNWSKWVDGIMERVAPEKLTNISTRNPN